MFSYPKSKKLFVSEILICWKSHTRQYIVAPDYELNRNYISNVKREVIRLQRIQITNYIVSDIGLITIR